MKRAIECEQTITPNESFHLLAPYMDMTMTRDRKYMQRCASGNGQCMVLSRGRASLPADRELCSTQQILDEDDLGLPETRYLSVPLLQVM